MRSVMLVLLLGCGVPRGGLGGDAGASDAPGDARLADAPMLDARLRDAPMRDARTRDAPEFDAPTTDAPMSDALIDAGAPDACAEVACNTGRDGICAAGTFSCAAGSCIADRVALGAELCGNGLDDDCEGGVDEGGCINCQDRFRDGRLYLFCTATERAVDARDECQAVSMRLVKIEDAAEQTWIETQIDEIDGGSLRSWWIGLYDALDLDFDEGGDRRNQHRWWPESSADPAPSYGNWLSGEPNSEDEDCVRIHDQAVRLWTDRPCDDGGSRFPYICEPTS